MCLSVRIPGELPLSVHLLFVYAASVRWDEEVKASQLASSCDLEKGKI